MNEINFLDKIEITKLEPTKFSIDLLSDFVAGEIREGKLNTLETVVYLNALNECIDQIREKVKKDVLDELDKYPKRKAELLGATVTEFSSVKYDYSFLPEWAELDAKKKEIDEQMKAIEAHEKTYHKGDLPVKSYTQSFKIQLSK